MRLQADPTVGYAAGLDGRARGSTCASSSRDVAVQHLPVRRPAAGPDLQSRSRQHRGGDAIATPAAKDLYFVARGDGRHLFAETYQQHLRNIAIARAMIAAQNGQPSIRPDTVAVLAPELAPASDSMPAEEPKATPTANDAAKPTREGHHKADFEDIREDFFEVARQDDLEDDRETSTQHRENAARADTTAREIAREAARSATPSTAKAPRIHRRRRPTLRTPSRRRNRTRSHTPRASRHA